MVYIVWVKGIRIILKILQAKSFAGTSQDGLSHEILAKRSLTLNSLAFSMCFSRGLFAGTYSRILWASRKIAQIFIAYLILNQLNIKSNTIKSHKIQENKINAITTIFVMK